MGCGTVEVLFGLLAEVLGMGEGIIFAARRVGGGTIAFEEESNWNKKHIFLIFASLCCSTD